MFKLLLRKIIIFLSYKLHINLLKEDKIYLDNIKFYGQFDIPVDKYLFTKYFLTKKNGFFVECGAYDGLTECSCEFFEENKGWKGINIEASPNIYKELSINRPNSININVALSNTNGIMKFNQPIHPHFWDRCNNGSILFLIIEFLKKFDYVYRETSYVNSIFTHKSYIN